MALAERSGAPGRRESLRASPSPPDGSASARPDAPALAESLVGQRLGHFDLLELIGKGGMGAVYKARQTGLDRLVAVKVLPKPMLSDADLDERFCREARAAAAVTHPHIVEVYDFGVDQGYQYIAMELVEGGSLAHLLSREGRMAPARAAELLREVAAALGEAHACAVVHRDIKPSNILLTAKGQAKVADFGLAKRQGVDVNLTLDGQMLGTPLYITPESARGEPMDARSDLYALGATIYHALAGHPPFRGSTVAELVHQHVERPVPPLAEAAPGTPPALCCIVHRLLAKDPAERYQNAAELLGALEALDPSPETPATSPVQPAAGAEAHAPAERPASRRRRAWAALAAAALAGAALVAVLVLARREPAREGWRELFDGKSLDGWRTAQGGFFEEQGRTGEARVEDGCIVLDAPGDHATGVAYLGAVPRSSYEIEFEGMRRHGDGNAASLAFPVGEQDCAWNLGNAVRSCGLDAVDDLGDAEPMNPTRREHDFDNGRWYRFRLCVEPARIQAWMDGERVVDLDPTGHKLRLWEGYADLRPLGLYAARSTEAKVRHIRLRPLKP